ncbi:MAG: RNA 2'-phosphotransferase [Clostridia bacterium]|nr:RNA 2'-phosphotransferase [Clostridia bacterium]
MLYLTPEEERRRRIYWKLSFVLRHRPENIGLTLDRYGWAKVDELIDKFDKTCGLDFSCLEKIVEGSSFKQFTFNEDKTLIRANYGHSIPVLFENKEEIPPECLYYAINEECMPDIEKEGPIKQDGVYVYLVQDILPAVCMGSRYGQPVIYRVDSKKMTEDGFKFYHAKNLLWLTNKVPKEYVEMITEF